jgi:murein L,D-transpeptidase YcbB/YkuD
MSRATFFLVITMLFMTACGKKAETPTTEEVVSEELVSAPETQAPQSPVVVQPETATTPVSQASSAEPVISVLSAATGAASTTVAPEKPSIMDIQKALKNAGLYTGKVDGTLGPKTKKAIEEFQKQNKLKADGKVGPKTWEKLKTYLK